MDCEITSDIVLFFDMDGTLIDTNYANFLAYKKAIVVVTKSDYNLVFNPDQRFNRNNLKNVIPNLTELEYENITQAKEQYYNDFLHETKLCKEVIDILFRYSKTNHTVLVTNSLKDRAMMMLNYFGLANHFDNIFCRELVNDCKGANKFSTAITKLGVLPSSIIAFENEKTEIFNAIQAGIKIVNPKGVKLYENI